MSKYSKGIGAIVGGVVGIVMAALGWTDAVGEVLPAFAAVQDALVVMITSTLGTVLSPKNTD